MDATGSRNPGKPLPPDSSYPSNPSSRPPFVILAGVPPALKVPECGINLAFLVACRSAPQYSGENVNDVLLAGFNASEQGLAKSTITTFRFEKIPEITFSGILSLKRLIKRRAMPFV